MKEILKRKAILYIGLALLLIGGSGLLVRDNSVDIETVGSSAIAVAEKPQTIISNADGTVVSYNGEAGKTALTILKTSAEVVTKDSSFGEYVITINGVEQSDSEYWLFYVNGKQANIGAGDYVTKEGDHVEWKLEG